MIVKLLRHKDNPGALLGLIPQYMESDKYEVVWKNTETGEITTKPPAAPRKRAKKKTTVKLDKVPPAMRAKEAKELEAIEAELDALHD